VSIFGGAGRIRLTALKTKYPAWVLNHAEC
jgi:hypothetical protein